MEEKKWEFSNPDCLPIEHVSITLHDGVVRPIKALDPYWVEKVDMLPYERPPFGTELIMGALDAWMAKMEDYRDTLKWLLSLDYHIFWSTIIYNPTCMDSLVSFLQEAKPPYMQNPLEDKEAYSLYVDIRKYVLIVFSRLSTNKESQEEWMTKEYMADLIYDKFIFSIPTLWDICLQYGTDNKQVVTRLVNSVFTLQPKYENDAVGALNFVNESFKYIILQVNKDYDTDEPPNLPETFKGFGEIRRPTEDKKEQTITLRILKDLVIHLLDTAMTLRLFIEVYPKSVTVFRKTNFVNSIVQIYEYAVPQLYEKLEELGDRASLEYTEIEGYMEQGRSELIDIYREILAVYKNAILSGEGSIESHVEDYLTVLMEGLAEKLMIRDYHANYPVNEDLDMIKQVYPDLDPIKSDYILQAIYSNLEEPVSEHLLSANQEAASTSQIETGQSEAAALEPQPSTSKDYQIPDNLKEESLISEVKDILPHLGEGFILKCLQHYGFNSERVINSILEDTLDPSLKALDQTLPIIPEDPLDKKFLETGIARLNVFDGDEFDIMTRDDVDVSRIHIGKRREKYKNLNQMLDDKTELKGLADMYNKYSLVYDEETIYDDEYDDTYDSDPGPPPADETPDEALGVKFVTPRALRPRVIRVKEESEEDSEDDDSNEAGPSNKSRLDFCQNPEEVRARREAAYQARRGKGHRPPPPPKATDVTGKPKGQGQEKEVLHNRDKKEKHKSARANHNRRQGAQWKRTQGMMPS